MKEEKEEDDDDNDDSSDSDRTDSSEWQSKELELATSSERPPLPEDPREGYGDVGVSLVSLGDSCPPYTTTANHESRTSSYYLVNMGMDFHCGGREYEEDGIPSDDYDDVHGNNDGDDTILFASSRNSARTTAVLCYNLAMTYHLRALAMSRGMHPQTQRAWHLNKALRLYDLVLNPTGLVDVGGSDSRNRRHRPDASALRIRAALYNNKGHAHHCLRETDHVKACVRALSMWAVEDEDDEQGDQQRQGRDGTPGVDGGVRGRGIWISRALGGAALPVALNVHLHSRGSNIHPASSA